VHGRDEEPRYILTANDLRWELADHENLLAGKRVRSKERRARAHKQAKEIRRLIPIAKRYQAECARIRDASGISAAYKRETAAGKALTTHVDAIMSQQETSMAGVMIKAQALAAWSNVPYCGLFSFEVREWGPKFGASIIRLAAEGGES
jgi:hypothetical protein